MSNPLVPGLPDPRVVLNAAQIDELVDRLAAEVGALHDDESVLVSALKGSLIFTSDLMKRLPINPRVDFVAISPFEHGGRVEMVKDLSLDVAGSRVVLVHDAIDTGLTTAFLLERLARHSPRSITVCTLIDKPGRRLVPLDLAHVGASLDEDFLIGYGLDFAGRYRNLNLIAAVDPAQLSRDPTCYLEWFYRQGAGEGRSSSG